MASDQRWGEGGAHLRALECVGRILDLRSTSDRSGGLHVICGFGAGLVDAAAAGHVRYLRRRHSCQVCVWPGHDGAALWEERYEAPEPRDWWALSASRRRLFDLLDSEHLAELPLVTDDATPSLLVLARAHPFDETESDRLTTARPSLLLLERLVDALLPARLPDPVPSGTGGTTDAELTARERQVLALLGEGLLARSIAARLEVSERTVHKHLGSIYRKLDAHDRMLAVRRGEALGLIAPAPARDLAREPAREQVAAVGW